MKQYWLVKSEPSNYSWQQFLKDKETYWDGVRNYAARNHLKNMRVDDLVLFYHSNEGLEVVGIAIVTKTFYQDPTTEETAWVAVDLKPLKTLTQPVKLTAMKQNALLKDIGLIKIGRLSVMPLSPLEFNTIIEMGQTALT
jgi:predicted RNA-binding protein with PUA-like domain